MAINEWKIWQKLGLVKSKQEKIDIDKDIDAVSLFLKDALPVAKLLKVQLGKMQKLRAQEKKLNKAKAHKDKLKKNLLDQLRVYDTILQNYEFFELDTDINGERVKKIAHQLSKRAQEDKIDKKILSKITKSERWSFNW